MPAGKRDVVAVLRRWTPWAGLLLMVLCVAWLHLVPAGKGHAVSAQPGGAVAVPCAVIDAGHGGDDSGTMRNGVLEKDLTLDVARRVERLLQDNGVRTIMTRNGDERISLAARATIANREPDCVFVSIHFDEGARASASGVQTFYAAHQVRDSLVQRWLPFLQPAVADGSSAQSQSLAGFVQEAVVSQTQAFNRGTRAEQFYVVAHVRHPAVLVEGGFLSNSDDLSKLTSEVYREQLAGGIVDGILRYRADAPPPAVLAWKNTPAE